MKELPLTRRKVAIVDDEDFDFLNQWKWHECQGYARRNSRSSDRKDRKRKPVLMHRVIMNSPIGMEIDHINGDGIDNRRSNLRIATHAQNVHNAKISINNKSGYKRVIFSNRTMKWQAYIGVNGKQIYLGQFPTAILASKSYEEASKKYHGEFGRTK